MVNQCTYLNYYTVGTIKQILFSRYRGKFEFFRYTPTHPEPVKVFPLKGIEVKMPESTPTKIILKNVSREISGQFVCEVTAEKPSFFTLIDSAELKVLMLVIGQKTESVINIKRDIYVLFMKIFQVNT